jgi:hypothetical protein
MIRWKRQFQHLPEGGACNFQLFSAKGKFFKPGPEIIEARLMVRGAGFQGRFHRVWRSASQRPRQNP